MIMDGRVGAQMRAKKQLIHLLYFETNPYRNAAVSQMTRPEPQNLSCRQVHGVIGSDDFFLVRFLASGTRLISCRLFVIEQVIA